MSDTVQASPVTGLVAPSSRSYCCQAVVRAFDVPAAAVVLSYPSFRWVTDDVGVMVALATILRARTVKIPAGSAVVVVCSSWAFVLV